MPSVLFVITDLHRGGAPLWLAELAPGLARRGWDVEVVSIAPEGEVAGILRERGVAVTSLNACCNKDVRVVGRLVRHLNARRPAVVMSILVHANLLAALALPFARRRKLAWVQSIHTVQEKPRWHWTVQGWISRRADAVVVPASAVLDKMRRHGPVPQATVIPNGIDVRRFFDARPVEDTPWPAGTRVLGYVGRFDPVKRLHLLLEAMPKLPGWHLALVGYGDDESRLRALAHQLGVQERVHFPGPTRQPERWYKAFDVFCLPSAAEAFPLSLAEAAAAGVPVVACQTAAIQETVEATEWMPVDGGAEAVARAVTSAAGKRNERKSLAELENRYSLERMVESYEAILGRLVRSRH